MATAKRKKAAPEAARPKRRRKKALEKGPDGLTFPQRLGAAMAEKPIGQSELARRCSELYASFFPTQLEPKVQQQHIFNALGTQATSEFLPLIAVVLDVNELWLQFGVGPKTRGS